VDTKLTLSRFELFLLQDGEKKITEEIFTGQCYFHSALRALRLTM
jgi:hypothetical protein